MTKKKKRPACQPIIDNELAKELFGFFKVYVTYGDKTCLKYVKKVIKILQNCSEVASLCKTLLEMDVVTKLTEVADQVLKDEFGEETLKVRDSVLLPILKTFD